MLDRAGYYNDDHLNDLYRFNTTALQWEQLDGAPVSGSPPSARSGHTMVAVGSELYVFGGRTDTGEEARGAYWPRSGGMADIAPTRAPRAHCCCAHAAAFSRTDVLGLATPGPSDTRGGTATVCCPHESEGAHRWACRIEGHSAHRGRV